MVENERQPGDKREAGDRRAPQFEPGILDALEQRLGASDSGMNCECGESPDTRKADIRNTFLSRGMREKNGGTCTHIDATDWNTARLTTSIPIRVDSEKLAASTGDGPILYAL